ncbi:MAG: hypothetical protein EA369_00645, partial [Bradymonadales bacterium]
TERSERKRVKQRERRSGSLTKDSKQAYRDRFGLASKATAKNFFAAKDIKPKIDQEYISKLLKRLEDLVFAYDKILENSVRPESVERFIQEKIYAVYESLDSNGLIAKFTNQGRRPEQVLFNWLRGHVTAEFFLPAIKTLLKASESQSIGEDDISSLKSFRRLPKADYLLQTPRGRLRLEVQAGFQGMNDIKFHKVEEARRVLMKENVPSLCAHLDIFNGQAALFRLDQPDRLAWLKWEFQSQMEGQKVAAIPEEGFVWKFLEPLPRLEDLELD